MVVKMGSTRHLGFSDFSDREIDHFLHTRLSNLPPSRWPTLNLYRKRNLSKSISTRSARTLASTALELTTLSKPWSLVPSKHSLSGKTLISLDMYFAMPQEVCHSKYALFILTTVFFRGDHYLRKQRTGERSRKIHGQIYWSRDGTSC